MGRRGTTKRRARGPSTPLRERLGEPVHSEEDPGILALKEAAWCELESLCRHVVEGSPAHWTVHVRVGRAGDELARVAEDVGADFVIVEAHDRPATHRMFHRSIVARIAHCAPCSVLTIRTLPRAGKLRRSKVRCRLTRMEDRRSAHICDT